ncbi:MAG: DNA-binding XRE family transcriptional regulator [Crocinitomicaceae bacterium]|jgi:DNA-binding XRE family transcriptional regulator
MINQKSFAFDCEMSRTQLYMIENGKTNPRLLTLIKISKGLELSVDELLKIS